MTHLALFVALYLAVSLVIGILAGKCIAFGDRAPVAEITASREDNTEGTDEE